MRNTLYILGISALVAIFIGSARAEQITLTTYYPAPYGVYNQMVTRTLGVGDNDGDGDIDSNDAPDPDFITGNPNDLWVAGNVGIGTIGPSQRLDVNGKIRMRIETVAEDNDDIVATKGYVDSSGGFTITSYFDSCDKCDRTMNLGPHKFCVLSGVGGPGGFNTDCRVYKSGDDWHLHIQDGDNNSQTHSCRALCFD